PTGLTPAPRIPVTVRVSEEVVVGAGKLIFTSVRPDGIGAENTDAPARTWTDEICRFAPSTGLRVRVEICVGWLHVIVIACPTADPRPPASQAVCGSRSKAKAGWSEGTGPKTDP